MIGTTVLTLSFFLIALNFRDGCATESKGGWASRGGAKDIALAIGTGNRTWSTLQNMELCERAQIYLPFLADFPDYTETISLALRTLNSFGGGTVKLDVGSYPVSAPIEMLSGTCLLGAGSSITIIKLQDNAASFGTKTGILRANKVEYIYVGSITLDGNRVNQDAGNEVEKVKRAGIQFTLANFVYIKDVAIKNNPGNGLNIRGEGVSSFSSHISFDQVHVYENGGDGTSFSKAAYVSIVDSILGQNGRHGISMSSSRHVLVRAVSIEKNEGSKTCGIAVRDATQDVLMEKVSIENATQAGICTRDSDGITVKFSTVENLSSNLAYCYHVRTTTGFESQDNICRILSGQEYNSDESIVVGLAPTMPTNKPVPTTSGEPQYIVINLDV